jgi:hypothetical protein
MRNSSGFEVRQFDPGIHIAMITEAEFVKQHRLCIVQTDQIGIINVGYFWALFFQYWVRLLLILRLSNDLKANKLPDITDNYRNNR